MLTTPRLKLFDYQDQAILRIRIALARAGSVVLQMPTGSGKTVTAAELIRQESELGPVWFVCHRREIIRQASRAFSALGVWHGVIAPRADRMDLGALYDAESPVKIASVMTLLGRAAKEEPPRLVIWDECHHVPAKSWSKIKEALPEAMHLGLTATPERLDGKGLSGWFSELVCGPSIGSLIQAKRLAPIKMFAPTKPDLTKARVEASDYVKKDADKIMSTPVLIGSAVDEYLRHAKGARALVFATSVDASRKIARRFNGAGIPAMHVDARTPVDVRDRAVDDLSRGKLKVLTNVEVFTEGVDVPEVDAVILMRPTRSLALYLQMVGRGMRVTAGKAALIVLDHAGLIFDHGFPDYEWEWSLDGAARARRIAAARKAGERVRRCPACTHVHKPSARCPECGYTYQMGREVGEFDGRLWAVSPEVAPGYAPVTVMARILNIPYKRVAAMGLEQDAYGMIHVETALAYLRKNPPTRFPPLFVAHPSEYIRPDIFARRVDATDEDIQAWRENGLPAAPNGWIHERRGLKWVRERRGKAAKALIGNGLS